MLQVHVLTPVVDRESFAYGIGMVGSVISDTTELSNVGMHTK